MISSSDISCPVVKNTYAPGEYWKAEDVNTFADATRCEGISTRLELLGNNILRVWIDGIEKFSGLTHSPLRIKLLRRPNRQSSRKEWYINGWDRVDEKYGAALLDGFVAPDWMPNAGVVQDEWEIGTSSFGKLNTYVDIDLSTWLLDAMRSINLTDGMVTGCFVGTKGGNIYDYQTEKFVRPRKPSVVTFSFVLWGATPFYDEAHIIGGWKNTIDIGSVWTKRGFETEIRFVGNTTRLENFYKKIK